jgi:hypothetical protein
LVFNLARDSKHRLHGGWFRMPADQFDTLLSLWLSEQSKNLQNDLSSIARKYEPVVVNLKKGN